MKMPAELYTSSQKEYKGLAEVEYPFHDKTITVTNCGRGCLGGKKINLSVVFAGQNVGIKEVQDKIWLVSFMNYDLGILMMRHADWNLWTILLVQKCYPCLRYRPSIGADYPSAFFANSMG